MKRKTLIGILAALAFGVLLGLFCGGCTAAKVGSNFYFSLLQNRQVTGLTLKAEGTNYSLKLEKSQVTGDAVLVEAATRGAAEGLAKTMKP